MSEVKNFTKNKCVDYPQQEELEDRIIALVNEYAGEMSVATATGILDGAKDRIKEACE